MWWRGIVMMMLGGVGMATGASAFVVPLLPGRRELVGRGPALRAACPAMQSVQRAGRARVSMDAEGARVAVVRAEDQWHELVAIAAETGSTLVVFFKKDFCRKCAAMKPKFAKLASEYVESDALWAEVDGVKLGKALRDELGIQRVPSFQIWGQVRPCSRSPPACL